MQNLKHPLAVFAASALVLFVSSIALTVSLRESDDNAPTTNLQNYSVTNSTGETIAVSFYPGPGPSSVGEQLCVATYGMCPPSADAIAAGDTTVSELERHPFDQTPELPIGLTAWKTGTEEVIYKQQFDPGELDQTGWTFHITDQTKTSGS